MRRPTFEFRLAVLGLICLLVAGCAPTQPLRHLKAESRSRYSRPALGFETVPEAGEPSTLDELIQVAVQHHPDLRAAQARVEAARGKLIQVGLYPNPIFGPRFNQLGDSVNPLGEAGAIVTQPIVTANKLGIARTAAARGVEAADWQAITKSYDVVTRVRLAYFEYLTALYERDTLVSIVGVSAKAFEAAKSLEKAGAGNRPDVLRAKVEFEQNQLRREVALRRVEAARQNLLTSLGRPPVALDRLDTNRHDLERTPPGYEWTAMLNCLRETSSELQEARSLIAQQESLLAKAQADVTPNIDVSAMPYYVSRDREMRAQIIVSAPIPIFDRNQGNIHSAQAELARAFAGERQLELLLTERLTGAYQRYQAARQQAATYRDVIVPEARTSRELIETGYRAGDKKYDYTAVLQAQQVLFQAQLSQTQAMGELWRAVSEIAGILQQADLMNGCAVRQPRSS